MIYRLNPIFAFNDHFHVVKLCRMDDSEHWTLEKVHGQFRYRFEAGLDVTKASLQVLTNQFIRNLGSS